MAKISTQSMRKLAPVNFFSCTADQDALFTVRDDAPVKEALEITQCLVSSARDAAITAAEALDGDQPHSLWATAYLLEIAVAVLEAAVSGIHTEERNHG